MVWDLRARVNERSTSVQIKHTHFLHFLHCTDISL